MLDERWIRALHVETMREEELHAEREHHVLFQASTIGALLDGAYDGDMRFDELAEHGGPKRALTAQIPAPGPRVLSRPAPPCARIRFAVSSAMGDPPDHATRGSNVVS